MKCFVCSKEAGYNRAVVGPMGEVRAGFCMRCEEQIFGVKLTEFENGGGESCSFCSNPGDFRLPKWLPRHELKGGDLYVENFVSTDENTVQLCQDHLQALRK